MQDNNKEKKQHLRYDHNPYWDKVYISQIRFNETVQLANTETGEVSEFVKSVEVWDRKKHNKVFSAFYAKVAKLKGEVPLRLLMYIQSLVDKDQDFVDIDIEEATEYCGCKPRAYTDAINNLLDLDFIARGTKRNRYYFNVSLFYNGKRKIGKDKNEAIKKHNEQKGNREFDRAEQVGAEGLAAHKGEGEGQDG